jgi:hypothetical protein
MFKITEPGIFLDVPAADYHADPCPAPSLTQSVAKVLLEKSPAHARLAHPRLAPPVAADDEEPEKYVSAQAIGDAAHALLIGRGKTLAVADFDSWRGKEPQKFKADAVAAGKLPILTKHMARAYGMVEAARKQMDDAGHHLAFEQESESAGEVVIAWKEDGLWLRSMIDWMWTVQRPLVVYDFKTSGLSCAPHAVEDRPSVMGWDIQAAMHERGLDAIDPTNAGRRKHYYVNQENEAPYALTVVEISEADLTMGRKKLRMAEDIWRRCMISGEWPLYPAETVLSRPRGYLETKWLEREVAHDDRKQRAPMPADHFMGG